MNQIDAAPPAGTSAGRSARRTGTPARQPQLPGFDDTPPALDNTQEQAALPPPTGAGPPEQAAPAEAGWLGCLNAIARQIRLFDGGNSTSPAAAPGPGMPEQKTAPAPDAAAEPAPPSAPPTVDPDRHPAADIPLALRNRYLIDRDGKYYFRDRDHSLAFEDLGTKLRTPHEDADTASSMVELAQAKGWTRLRLRGSDAFKREAWLAAAERGIAVTGHRPTPLDKARLAERLAAREREATRRANAIERMPVQQAAPQASVDTSGKKKAKTPSKPGATGPLPAAADTRKRKENNAPAAPQPDVASPRHQRAVEELKKFLRQRGDSEAAVAMTAAMAAEELARHRTHYGRLLEHGPARYQHNADNDLSYFVTLQTPGGRQTIWGVDLQRAMADSGVDVGDGIVLSQHGSRSVTVTGPELDSQGMTTGKRVAIAANRHAWQVISLDNAKEFLESQPGTRKQPGDAYRGRPGDAPHGSQDHGHREPALHKER